MTIRTHNRGQLPLSLLQFLNVQGSTSGEFDDTISPTVLLADVSDSPFAKYGRLVGGQQQQAAVAAKNSYCIIRPGPNVSLQILKYRVVNDTAGAISSSIRLLTAAQIATLGTRNAINMVVQLGNGRVSGTTDGPSNIETYAFAGFPSDQFSFMTVPANSEAERELPKPGIILNGNDESGVPGLAIIGITVNVAQRVEFFGREWPLPGAP